MRIRLFIIKILHRRCFAGFVSFALIWMCGCATPVGVWRVNERVVYQQIDRSALTANAYSGYTAVVLHRHGFNKNDFAADPAALVRNLHEIAARDDRRDLLLSLSELCFLAGKKARAAQKEKRAGCRQPSFEAWAALTSSRPLETADSDAFFRAAAVYAYLYLIGPGSEPPPGPFDRRFRLACDLYNRGLAKLLSSDGGRTGFREKTVPLPVGSLQLSLKTADLPWNVDEVERVLPADAFLIRGLSVRNRIPGMGAPIISVRKKKPGKPVAASASGTVFMEVVGNIGDIAKGRCRGEISVFTNYDKKEIMIGRQKVPLEADLSAPIAYSLDNPVFWTMGRKSFRFGRSVFPPGLYPAQPYQPDRIPVVLVHGTMSSMVTWAEMLNTLNSDPMIRKKYQIWLYLYDSGKPVVFSAVHLRESIQNKISALDPDGRDPALRKVVAIGHSQGGLLARFTAVDTGGAIVRAVWGKTLDELGLSRADRDLLSRYTVFEPLPEVRRVVFISTPHRGSILAGSFIRRLATRLIRLPKDVLQTGRAVLNITERFSAMGMLKWKLERTSIDSMSPRNPTLRAVADLPFPENVKGHSIIAIKGNDTPPEGDDGVVSYESAHIDGVESELVVPYGHSCQMEPQVIEEVRRILIEHLTDRTADLKRSSVDIDRPVPSSRPVSFSSRYSG